MGKLPRSSVERKDLCGHKAPRPGASHTEVGAGESARFCQKVKRKRTDLGPGPDRRHNPPDRRRVSSDVPCLFSLAAAYVEEGPKASDQNGDSRPFTCWSERTRRRLC